MGRVIIVNERMTFEESLEYNGRASLRGQWFRDNWADKVPNYLYIVNDVDEKRASIDVYYPKQDLWTRSTDVIVDNLAQDVIANPEELAQYRLVEEPEHTAA